jgi:hypothetical protein
MLRVYGLLCVAGLVASMSAAPANTDNILITVPMAPINALIQSFLPVVEKKINAIALPTCCYDDVGVKHIHLNFQNMVLSNATVGVDAISSSGLRLNISFAVHVTGFYRLCLHDDPFSKHACSTIEGCKGDFSLLPSYHALVVATLGATASGQLQFSFAQPQAQLALGNNLCSLFSSNIAKYLPKIQADLDKEVAALLQKVTAKVLAIFPREVHSGPIADESILAGLFLAFDQGALLFGGQLVVTLNATKQTGPFQ